jgi:uncharacterized protein YndB with AHSA1/START domain
MPTSTQRVHARVTRHLSAAPERVFDAWLDPAWLSRWMFGPAVRDEEIVRLERDPKPGGAFSFVVRRGGVEIDHVGTYLVIDRPRRLVFTWAVRGASDDAPSRVAIDLTTGAGGGCDLSLTHEMDAKWAEHLERTQAGWTTMVETLDRALGQ